MPIAIAFIALIILVAAVRGTYTQLFGQLVADMPGFAVWAGAMLAIGLLGYIPGAETPSRYLLALVFLVLVLGNGKAAFPNFVAAFTKPATPAPAQPVAPQPLGKLPVVLTGSLGGGGAPGGNTGIVGGAAGATGG